MDESTLRQIITDCYIPMRAALGLNDWSITIVVDRLDGLKAEIEYRTCYRCAAITFDPSGIKDRDDLLDTLRHEMLHLLHAETSLYEHALRRSLSREAMIPYEQMITHAHERLVGNLERMLDSNSMTPQALIDLGRLRINTTRPAKPIRATRPDRSSPTPAVEGAKE